MMTKDGNGGYRMMTKLESLRRRRPGDYDQKGGGWLILLTLVLFFLAVWQSCGCVTAVDHAGEYDQDAADLFGPWTLELREASGATSYSVMDFQDTGCLRDELVRVDGAGNVESRVVYGGTWEPGSGTLDLREPGEPEVVDHYELRGDELEVDGVTYHRGRAAPPTLVGTWRSEDGGGEFSLKPGGVFSEPADLGYFKPGLGLGTDLFGYWDVAAGRLEIHEGYYASTRVVSIEAYQIRLDPGGLYDLVLDNAVGK